MGYPLALRFPGDAFDEFDDIAAIESVLARRLGRWARSRISSSARTGAASRRSHPVRGALSATRRRREARPRRRRAIYRRGACS
jgi:hypothetical protein